MNNSIKYLALLTGFMLVSNSTTIFPIEWGNGYYVVLLFSLIYITSRGIKNIERALILLYGVAALSLAVNDVPSFFKAWSRLGSFILLTLILGPTFSSKISTIFRIRVFSTLMILMTCATASSALMLLWGRGYGAGDWFEGITVHSMIMGPIAAMGILYSFFQLQYRHKRKRVKLLCYLIIIGGLLCILQTGSRTSMIGTICAVSMFVYICNKQNFALLVRKYIWIILILGASFPAWNRYMDKLEEKNQGETTTINTDSREIYWIQRLDEWKSSPIYGIGFSTVDAAAEGSNLDTESGNVETGSSWLGVLSMTGILGFACIIIIFYHSFIVIWRMSREQSKAAGYLLAIMLFFIVHMMAEGYVFAGGSFLNAQVWLLLGVMIGLEKYPEYAEEFIKELRIP